MIHLILFADDIIICSAYLNYKKNIYQNLILKDNGCLKKLRNYSKYQKNKIKLRGYFKSFFPFERTIIRDHTGSNYSLQLYTSSTVCNDLEYNRAFDIFMSFTILCTMHYSTIYIIGLYFIYYLKKLIANFFY